MTIGDNLPTLGLEEEVFVVDAETYHPVCIPPLCAAALKEALGARFGLEYKSSVLELITAKHTDPSTLLEDAVANRFIAEETVSQFGLKILPLPSHPTADAVNLPAREGNDRYRRIEERKGDAVRHLAVNGVHLHVGTYSELERRDALPTLMHLVPVHAALTACSVYYNGRDTGQASYRLRVLLGLAPSLHLSVADDAERAVLTSAMKEVGGPADASEHWGLIRLGAGNKPTIEFRAADTSPDLSIWLAISALSASAAYALRRGWLQRPEFSNAALLNIYNTNVDSVAAGGMRAKLIDPFDMATMTAANYVARWIDRCAPAVDALGVGRLIESLGGTATPDGPAETIRDAVFKARLEGQDRGLSPEHTFEFAARRLVQHAWELADRDPPARAARVYSIAA